MLTRIIIDQISLRKVLSYGLIGTEINHDTQLLRRMCHRYSKEMFMLVGRSAKYQKSNNTTSRIYQGNIKKHKKCNLAVTGCLDQRGKVPFGVGGR